MSGEGMAPRLLRSLGRLGGGVRSSILTDFCGGESRKMDARTSSKKKQNGAERHFLLPTLMFELEEDGYRGSGKREHKGLHLSGKCNASDCATPVATRNRSSLWHEASPRVWLSRFGLNPLRTIALSRDWAGCDPPRGRTGAGRDRHAQVVFQPLGPTRRDHQADLCRRSWRT